MRLSTSSTQDEPCAIAVIHAALDAGATLLDTADAYCIDENDVGHNERLVARVLRTWRGDPKAVTVATKGGLRRPGGRWVPDGRAVHLRNACAASCRALDVGVIDLYQLHAVDPRTPIETSVRALAALQQEGKIRRIGLCNVTVSQIEAARRIADIFAVQVQLSVLDDENVRNGVAEYCRDHGIRLIAYRPLGGERNTRIARHPGLAEIAARHDATPHELALAWLLHLDPCVVPIPGATRVATAASLSRVQAIALTDADLAVLDVAFPAGRLLRVPRSSRRPRGGGDGELVLVMGVPGAGKSSVAREFVARGFERLNRDSQGGRLSDLVRDLDAGLAAGKRRWVLDNTYASRAARNEVIECAWRHNVPVRCVWLRTTTADAQINAIERLIAAHSRLPMPEELRTLGKGDHRYFGPDAQFRYERQLEAPVADEGFTLVEERLFERRGVPDSEARALLLEYDDVLCTSASGASVALEPDDVDIPAGRVEALARLHAAGWRLFASAWRPQVQDGTTTDALVAACFERTRELLGLEIEMAYCPHPAGPPICWCRKPLPGLVLEFVMRHGIAVERCVMVGRSQADRTLARRLGMTFHDAHTFFPTGDSTEWTRARSASP